MVLQLPLLRLGVKRTEKGVRSPIQRVAPFSPPTCPQRPWGDYILHYWSRPNVPRAFRLERFMEPIQSEASPTVRSFGYVLPVCSARMDRSRSCASVAGLSALLTFLYRVGLWAFSQFIFPLICPSYAYLCGAARAALSGPGAGRIPAVPVWDG